MKKIYKLVVTCLLITTANTNAHAKDIFQGITDVVVGWDQKMPEKSGYIDYSNHNLFDVKMNASLNYHYHNVNVDMDGAYLISEMPDRMERWLEKVVTKKGSTLQGTKRLGMVKVCTAETTGGYRFFWKTAKWLFKKAKEYVTYRPTKNYDAYIMLNQSGYIEKVKFFHKRSDWERPKNCEHYIDYRGEA